MFSGIITGTSQICRAWEESQLLRIELIRPAAADFSDVKTGDSVAINGICLTVEKFTADRLQFALAPETLKVTGWNASALQGSIVNVEPSLKLGDRIHGHLVSGHVDTMAKVVGLQKLGDSLQIDIEVPQAFQAFIWPKGSWAINGVSLTINWEQAGVASSCLIPETLLRTNLQNLKLGSMVTLEVDQYARGLVHFLKNSSLQKGQLNEHDS